MSDLFVIALQACGTHMPAEEHDVPDLVEATGGATFYCLFIGVLGRVDCSGHFAPITQVIRLTRGVCHGEFDVKDIGEKSTRLDPNRIISKEMTESDVCGNVSEVTSTANTVPRASQQYVRYG